MQQIKIGRVKFIDVPKGEAPLEIRKCWVGIEVPCLCYQERPSLSSGDGSFGAITGEKKKFQPIYIINQRDAIEELWKVSPEAAKFWNNCGYPQSHTALFSFNAECAEILEPVMSYEEFISFADVN